MTTKLHVRDSFPWLAAGVGLILLTIAIMVVIAVLVEDAEESLAFPIAAWVGFVLGGAVILKALLVVIEELGSRQALALAGLTLVGGVLAVVLHNLIYGLFGVEEGVFFILAIFVAPPVLVAALIRAVHPGHGPHGPAPPAPA
ncbi:MAG TPA: hypothetical protein VFY90_10830 [Tepidiformaceae bacterium]|nr:hypothetical protein [Tepidiformaceae bacterium]